MHRSLRRHRAAAFVRSPICCRERHAPAVHNHEKLKTKLGRLDFLDLLLKTRDLVRDNADVRGDPQERFSHFFVDEFQDTDPLQAEILILLSVDDPARSDWRAVDQRFGDFFDFDVAHYSTAEAWLNDAEDQAA
jgi:superfamily I DNA/RNA helicase